MKPVILFVLILFSTAVFAQEKQHPPPPPIRKKVIRSNQIKYSLLKRSSFYPFNKCSQIKLVSFGLHLDSNQLKIEDNCKLPTLNDTICFSKLDETKTLTKSQIDTLSDILYNECSRWNFANYTEAGCYYPRNAILFFDKDGRAFEYLEIAFDCTLIKLSNSKFIKPDLCDHMYEKLQAFFTSNGLKTSSYELKRVGH